VRVGAGQPIAVAATIANPDCRGCVPANGRRSQITASAAAVVRHVLAYAVVARSVATTPVQNTR
jgi:hypothetical protein